MTEPQFPDRSTSNPAAGSAPLAHLSFEASRQERDDLQSIERNLGYVFRRPELLQLAVHVFTQPAFERHSWLSLTATGRAVITTVLLDRICAVEPGIDGAGLRIRGKELQENWGVRVAREAGLSAVCEDRYLMANLLAIYGAIYAESGYDRLSEVAAQLYRDALGGALHDAASTPAETGSSGLAPDAQRRSIEQAIGHTFSEPRFLGQALAERALPGAPPVETQQLEALGFSLLMYGATNAALAAAPRLATLKWLRTERDELLQREAWTSSPAGRNLMSRVVGVCREAADRPEVLHGICRALIGAVHRDAGFEKAAAVCTRLFAAPGVPARAEEARTSNRGPQQAEQPASRGADAAAPKDTKRLQRGGDETRESASPPKPAAPLTGNIDALRCELEVRDKKLPRFEMSSHPGREGGTEHQATLRFTQKAIFHGKGATPEAAQEEAAAKALAAVRSGAVAFHRGRR